MSTHRFPYGLGEISDLISAGAREQRTGFGWRVGFFVSSALVLLLLGAVTWLFCRGIGIWGVNIPIAWGFAIVNFVWWIGIGHAGTFISAILLLCNQTWRTSINRLAEAMTLFAVSCAALFPLLHLGRPWRVYWLVPYPNTMGLGPQFRSPLIWDEFAVATYATVSLLFWYLGLIPDLATLRDDERLPVARRKRYGLFALGWRGTVRDWQYYDTAYRVLAGLATPLVVSVHSVVSLDFAAAQLPGWHDTIFPPYFVAGAIFSGFAMVLTVCIPVRRIYGLEKVITERHLDQMAKIMLLTGLMVAYGYVMETFSGWLSGDEHERFLAMNRLFGPYWLATWLLLFCNIAVPQLLWWPSIRKSPAALFGISLAINVGMWLERFVIVVVSLHRDFLQSSWGMYTPTFWDYATLVGSMGLFCWLLLLFIRSLPAISMHEVRELCGEEGA